jgi:putative alpha-1,2-mannosidase
MFALLNFKGMAKAVADSTADDQGGFASDSSTISGFSHMHDSGTGGVSTFPRSKWGYWPNV